MHEKKRLILDHERRMANELATRVLDKPKPPLWMIFVPVFFVFFAQKMKDYAAGLKDFVENYLASRERALEAAMEARQTGQPLNPDAMASAVDLPDHARPQYAAWMELLVEHYDALLASPGSSLAAMTRSAYRTKTAYLLFCNTLNKIENAFNLALLPEIHGDAQDLRHVIDKMNREITELRRRDADTFFS
jgi:cytochrome P450